MKVREGSVKGNVKVFFKVGKLSQSVKVREGNVKGHVKLFEICDFVAIREGPWREREDFREAIFNMFILQSPLPRT